MRRLILPVLVLCLGTARVVSADPLTITSGQAVAALTGSGFSFNGQGLSASTGLPDGWSTSVVNACNPCTADQARTLSFSSTCESCLSSGSSGNELGGIVYSSPVTFFANFAFHGPAFSSRDLSPDRLTLTAPFTMTGTLAAVHDWTAPDPPFYSTDLVGSGTATIHFSTLNPFFWADNITYDFSSNAPSPTPEPASMLLLGTGLAAAWQSRRLRPH